MGMLRLRLLAICLASFVYLTSSGCLSAGIGATVHATVDTEGRPGVRIGAALIFGMAIPEEQSALVARGGGGFGSQTGHEAFGWGKIGGEYTAMPYGEDRELGWRVALAFRRGYPDERLFVANGSVLFHLAGPKRYIDNFLHSFTWGPDLEVGIGDANGADAVFGAGLIIQYLVIWDVIQSI